MVGFGFWFWFWLCSVLVGVFGVKYDDTTSFNSHGFVFLGKFCYNYHNTKENKASGIAQYDLTNANNYNNGYFIVLYDDVQYNIKNNDSLTCEQKIDYATYKREFIFDEEKNYSIEIDVFDGVRPRFWWGYVVNCQNRSNLGKISFHTHMYQYDMGSWNRELGYNELGLNTMYLTYMATYLILFGVQFYAYYVYRVSQYVHQIIKILTAVIGLQFIAVSLHFIDWMVYTETGYRQLVFEVSGAVFEIVASALFTLLLFVLAQGWTISRFDVLYAKPLLCGIIVLALLQLLFFIWRLLLLDPETTEYFYNFLPMWCYGILSCTIGIVYFVQCWNSYRNEPLESKKSLYLMLMIFFTSWFFIPLLRIVVAESFDAWSRDVFILTIELTWDTVTFLLMMGLMWPSRAPKYFNLSTKDTQNRMLSSHATITGTITGGSGHVKSDFQILETEMDVDVQEMDDVAPTQLHGVNEKHRYNQLAEDRL